MQTRLKIKYMIFGFRKHLKRRKDYTPVRWDKYFEGKEDIKVGENVRLLLIFSVNFLNL